MQRAHSSNPIGVDIGHYSVKIAKIKKSLFGKKNILAFSSVPLNAHPSRQDIVDAIRQAAKELSIESKKVNFSLSGPQVIIRYIIFPVMKESDLAQSLEFELEKYVPFKKEEAVITHHILTRIPNNQMIVLLVAAGRAFIQERISLITDAGLEPQSITIDALALCEAFKAASAGYKGVAAILDIGYSLSKLVVLENNIPFFSRDIEVGEYDIVQMISQRMNIAYSAARDSAYADSGRNDELAELAKSELHSLLNELSLSFEYCERNLEKTVKQIFLCGGGAAIKIAIGRLARIPNVKVSFLDITQGFSLSASSRAQPPDSYAPFLAVACGLALS